MTQRPPGWLQTYTGRYYYPLDPKPEDVSIADIAHALAHLCRYGGHTRRFYSVAEHSVYVSKIVPHEHALQGLMHDATEAYVVDVPRPIKRHLDNYAQIENKNWHAICIALDIPTKMAEEVHWADTAILKREMDIFFDGTATPSGETGNIIVPDWVRPIGLAPEAAEKLFLHRYYQLRGVGTAWHRHHGGVVMKTKNAVRCKKCGDEIESKHVHDFVTCECGSVSVDGGGEYKRRLWPSGDKNDWFEEIE